MVYVYGYGLSEWKLRGQGQLGWFPASSTAPGRPRARVVPLPLSVHGTAGPGMEGAQAPPAPPRSASPAFPQLTGWGPPTCLSHACNAPPLTSPKLVLCDARFRPSPRGQRLGPSSKAYPFSLNGNGGSRSCSRAVRGPNDGESPLRLWGGFRWDPSRTPRRGLGSETFGPRDPALRRAGGAGNRRPPASENAAGAQKDYKSQGPLGAGAVCTPSPLIEGLLGTPGRTPAGPCVPLAAGSSIPR